MFLPLYDGMRLRYQRRPFATHAFVAFNIASYILVNYGLFGDPNRIDTSLGVIPAVVFGAAQLSADLTLVPVWATFFTAPFLHANFLHLVGNMLFLWVFGDNVEDAMGTRRFVVFYLLSSIFGTLVYCVAAAQSQSPLIGASAGVSGVVAAYLMLYPRTRVFGLVFQIVPIRIPALYIIGAWILFQIGSALMNSGGDVGWWAHVGGIVAGAGMTPFLKRRSVPLLSRETR